MYPVAGALDSVQGEEQAYLGWLLPIVASTIVKLKDVKDSRTRPLIYCHPLVSKLLRASKEG
jgi:hypothetical protein